MLRVMFRKHKSHGNLERTYPYFTALEVTIVNTKYIEVNTDSAFGTIL